MSLSRPFLVAAVAAALFAGGCARSDNVLLNEYQTENARLTQELNALQETARNLEIERNYVQEENVRLRAQARGLEQQLRGIKAGDVVEGFRANPETGGVTADQDLFFRLGSAEITPEGEAALTRLAQVLNGAEYRDTIIVIEGHTDNTPVTREATVRAFGDNWGLSAMRAAAVIRLLESKGIQPTRLRGAFAGEHRPAAPNTTRENKGKNRRVEIFLTLGSSR
ncbi:MAG: hypothetical protein EA402_08695 [Planctomycetota bacterium]|nr:MAG: hypothetical protein EA402_08695 [Planctomycetota bacterium]